MVRMRESNVVVDETACMDVGSDLDHDLVVVLKDFNYFGDAYTIVVPEVGSQLVVYSGRRGDNPFQVFAFRTFSSRSSLERRLLGTVDLNRESLPGGRYRLAVAEAKRYAEERGYEFADTTERRRTHDASRECVE